MSFDWWLINKLSTCSHHVNSITRSNRINSQKEIIHEETAKNRPPYIHHTLTWSNKSKFTLVFYKTFFLSKKSLFLLRITFSSFNQNIKIVSHSSLQSPTRPIVISISNSSSYDLNPQPCGTKYRYSVLALR